MRTRAFRPEAPACLEGRSLLSGLAGPSADPFVLTQRNYTKAVSQMRSSFIIYNRNRDLHDLRDALYNVVVMIPFWQADGLRTAADQITETMRQDLAAHVPHAIRSASDELIAVARATVEARVQAGDVIVR